MSRMTRKKAAEVAEQLHIDEDALLELPTDDITLAAKAKAGTPDRGDRAPLGDLGPNSADSRSQSDDGAQGLKKSVRGKKGGKKVGAKGKKNNLGASTASQPEAGAIIEDAQEVLPDENDSAPSPASEKAAEDLMKEAPELSISNSPQDTTPKSPQSAAVRLTRSQLATKEAELEPEPKSLVDGIGQEQYTMKEETTPDSIVLDDGGVPSDVTHLPVDAPASPILSAVPNVIANLRTDTPGKRSTSNKENMEPVNMDSPQPSNYDVMENAAVTTATSPEASRQSPSRPEDHIAALDELDDAVENVSKDIPEVQTSPEKPKSKKREAPVVRTTKASQARISMSQNKEAANIKPPTLGRPSLSKPLGRASSVRQSSIQYDSAGRRVPSSSGGPEEKVVDDEKKEAVIPHSKPRPFSMSFPTPPPPQKSTKPPTRASFKLPGEAIAEKQKAAREARMAKEAEAEEQKKKTFKARPVPASLSKAPSVRQTTASKARESIMNGRDLNASTSGSVAPHKRAGSVATTRPSAPISRVVSRDTSKPAATNGTSLAPSITMTKKRPSTAMASMSKPRSSLATSRGPLSTSIDEAPSASLLTAKGTSKGKEVFNRAAVAKASADKEKHEKEAAAKKARADAAERSRQLSREWAEKQKKKQMASKQAVEKKAEPTVSEVEPGAEPAADATDGA